MEIQAKVKHIRTSPRKTRLVVDVIRGMNVGDALNQLKFINKKVVKPVEKLVKSCIANAEHNYELDKNNLYIKEIRVDEGATLKRWMPRAHGRATPIRKRTSHIKLILSEIKDSGEVKAKKQKIEEPVKLGEMGNDNKAKKDENKDKKEAKKSSSAKATADKEGVEIKSKVSDLKSEGKSKKSFAKKMFRRKSG